MKKKFLLIILILAHFLVFGQINKYGTPLISNFSQSEYKAEDQNWSVCEDQRGVMYIGNNDGNILEYDGKNWKKIPISNNSIVRSLVCSDDGIVYVGGVNEFGYLAPNINGEMKYISLIDQLDSLSFSDVWKIFTNDDEIYFCASKRIFKYKNKKLIKEYINDKKFPFLSFMVNDKLYWGSYDGGLFEIKNDEVILSVGGEFYSNKDIFLILPWSESELFISTMMSGTFIYNTSSGLSKEFSTLGDNYIGLNKEFSKSQVYNGIRLSNGDFALATLNNGCLIFEKSGRLKYKLNKDNGLQDITIINLFEDSKNNLWLGLNKGLSFVELYAPFTKFGQNEYNIDGIISNIIEFNSITYVSTNTALYYLDFDENKLPLFKKIEFENSIKSFYKYKVPNSNKEKLILATNRGVYELINPITKPIPISGQEGSDAIYDARVVCQSKINPNILYVGDNTEIATLEYKNGNWTDLGPFNGFKANIETIVEDYEGTLWLGTTLSGIIKFNVDSTFETYGVEHGLPGLQENKTYYINNEVVCATTKGLYVYDKNANNFNKYSGFGESFLNREDEIRSINFGLSDNEYWIVSISENANSDYLEKLTISQDRIINLDSIPFKRLVNSTFHNVYRQNDSILLLATTDAVYAYMDSEYREYSQFYNSLIRKVSIRFDSILFKGTNYADTLDFKVSINQPDLLKPIASFKDRSFVIFFSTPYFPNNEMKYSFKLEGYENEWSPWDTKDYKDYTNLDEGKYIFLVKAKNIYGVESDVARYQFTIKPPWYKTIVAYLFYVILAIFIIIIIVKIYTRRLEQEKIRLEQIVKERTLEVVKQKEEIEEQRDEISAKNKSITDSIEYASRIQSAILPSDEYAKEILPEHFILFRPRDIVSGDFYWITQKDNLLVVIAADCTGHGVPGAFMSMLGVSFLNEIVNRHEITSANVILNNLRSDIKKTLGQEGKEGEAKDGMDIALCVVDTEKMKMQYAGAYNPLYLFRDNELIETKADRMPIGIYIKEKDSFTNHEIDLQKGDVFYIFSDGFQDQFGGEDGMKFKTKNFKKLLLDIHQKPMAEQRDILDKTVDDWRGEWEQVDDIIILGMRV